MTAPLALSLVNPMTKPLPRILLVDDEPNNLLLLEELLQSQGYETLVASSGSQALEIVQDFLPDLILLDVMMQEWGALKFAADCGKIQICKRCR
jgi:CheY-like chemotaxis protein